MRTLINATIRVGFVAALATVLAQPAARAQEPGTVIANIPFAFQVGSAQLGPGTYTLENDGDILWIKSKKGSAVMMVLKDSSPKPSTDSAVVFHHYGSQYFLREVRTAGNEGFLWSSETKAERRAKVELAAANPNSGPRADSKVEVALLTMPR